HILLHKGIYTLPFLNPTSGVFITRWTIYVLCYCAVNCFALISGYVGIDRTKVTLTPAVMLWLRTFFYTFIITLLFFVFMPSKVGKTEWLGAFFPIYTNQYWYISSYFGLLVIMPLLNKGINSVDVKRLKMLTMALIAVFSIAPTFLQNDVMNTNAGFSTIWLIILYIIGAYLKRRGSLKSSVLQCFICYLSMSGISLAVKMILSNFHNRYDYYELAKSNPLISYTSPTLLGASIFLVLAFSQIKVHEVTKKVITMLSPLALGVYIIHVHPLIWLNVLPLMNRFSNYENVFTTIVSTLLAALFVYLVCMVFEFLRSLLFKALKLQELVSKAGEKAAKKIFDII
ncbi:MAG: acyltransferase, partial [Firmicutes bacterium]|nr:acyltransferase [Bacillota bacterium]